MAKKFPKIRKFDQEYYQHYRGKEFLNDIEEDL